MEDEFTLPVRISELRSSLVIAAKYFLIPSMSQNLEKSWLRRTTLSRRTSRCDASSFFQHCKGCQNVRLLGLIMRIQIQT